MKISVLERMMVAQRSRPKVSVKVGGAVPPVVAVEQTSPDEAPFLVNKAKGGFILTKPSNVYGGVLQVYTGCPVEQEDHMLVHLYAALWVEGKRHGWSNRFPSLDSAMSGMTLPPKVAVVPFSTLKEIAGNDLTEEEAERLTLAKGCVAEVMGVKIISARGALPEGTAILATTPELVGRYSRVNDYLAIMVFRADRSLVLVGAEDAVA